jgi:hypothetical protein
VSGPCHGGQAVVSGPLSVVCSVVSGSKRRVRPGNLPLHVRDDIVYIYNQHESRGIAVRCGDFYKFRQGLAWHGVRERDLPQMTQIDPDRSAECGVEAVGRGSGRPGFG